MIPGGARVHVHLDAIGGIAGDMFLAAMLDARPDLADGALAAMRAAGLPDDWTVEIDAHRANGLTGRRVRVAGTHRGHTRAHRHPRTFRDIRALIAESGLGERVKRRATAIFRLLAEAEAAVHGVKPDDVHFHEVADWDSVADIVGAAFVIEALGNPTWSVSALPLGGGRVKTAHGILPVPAPATARLVEGFATVDDGVAGERVTPTGAAILRFLAPTPRRADQGRLIGSGTGFGSRSLAGIPNILRALLFEGTPAESTGRAVSEVAVLAFEVDDQTPEDLAVGLDKLRQRADVLDVLQAPVFGKKGRLAMGIQVLCRPAAVTAVAAACFTETTTIGLRWHVVHRYELARESVEADGIRVKVVRRPVGGTTAKADMDDLRPAAGGRKGRATRRAAAEAGALRSRRKKDKKA